LTSDHYSDVRGCSQPLPSSFLLIHLEDRSVDMSTALFFGLRALSQTLTTNEALSGVFGSISLATWIFLLVCAKERLWRAIEDIFFMKSVY
jgi:hypothetical protein